MCGIAGAYGVENASYIVSLMLKAMQHRGQEAAGIVSVDDSTFHEFKNFGLADEVFADVEFKKQLPGTSAIGHLRYPTTGESRSFENIQPLTAKLRQGWVAIVHNGNLTNFLEKRDALERKGSIFRSDSDTELFLHLLAGESAPDFGQRLRDTYRHAEGAFSLLVLSADSIHAAVDPYGFRPLAVARYGDGWVFASETCAFDLLQAEGGNTLKAGETIDISSSGIRQLTPEPREFTRHCSFEHVYFTRPDSKIFGVLANDVRERLGVELAKEVRIKADVVIAVPDSSNVVALRYAQETGIPFGFGLIRNHYTGRTFITPKQKAREFGVRVKLNAVRSIVDGNSVAVVDDSLVRGTTGRKVVELLRDAGAKEVHLLIASPPVVHPCYWGIDTPRRQELIAAEKSIELIGKEINADSLHYLSVAGLRKALEDPSGNRYCTTCFTGSLPIQLSKPDS